MLFNPMILCVLYLVFLSIFVLFSYVLLSKERKGASPEETPPFYIFCLILLEWRQLLLLPQDATMLPRPMHTVVLPNFSQHFLLFLDFGFPALIGLTPGKTGNGSWGFSIVAGTGTSAEHSANPALLVNAEKQDKQDIFVYLL